MFYFTSFLHTFFFVEVHISVAAQQAAEIVWEPFPNIVAITKPIKQVNFIKIFIDGPEVSLNGSPTVSPVYLRIRTFICHFTIN
jgi:hypothetical protein